MNKSETRIPYSEFANSPTRVVDRVLKERISIVVEKEGKPLVVVKPARPARKTARRRTRKKSAAAYKAFLSSAGGWKDVDTDRFLEDNYASRRMSSRPPVEL